MKFTMLHRPDLSRVEIDITTKCNCQCVSCDRRCTQALDDRHMPVAILEQFVSDSAAVKYPWDTIAVLGGEPTLHPEVERIVDLLSNYVKTSRPECELSLVTNATGRDVQGTISKIAGKIDIVRRPKQTWTEWFNNVDIAPIDVTGNVSSCHIVRDCGVGFSSRGFFPCGPAAAIARVLNMESQIKRVLDIARDLLEKTMPFFCQYCGHALAIPLAVDDKPSPFWLEAYRTYRFYRGSCKTRRMPPR